MQRLHRRDPARPPPPAVCARDFDVSPYFEIVKSTLRCGFDYRTLQWGEKAAAAVRRDGRAERA